MDPSLISAVYINEQLVTAINITELRVHILPHKRLGDWIMSNQRAFTKFASTVSHFSGSPAVIGISVFTVVAWLLSGPIFHYSDTWQLVMNTWTNVITFLMVFLIQNSQNRDGAAIQLKLDELIRVGQARNLLVGVEKLDEAEIRQLKEQLETRAARE